LFDWNQDGRWTPGWAGCPPHGAYEHVVKNFHVPQGSGRVGDHEISRFYSGPEHGYVWARFSITNQEVELEEIPGDPDHWDGSGLFPDGETEDYLLYFNGDYARDFGDAPDSALAYPATGQMGYFPTCLKSIGGSPGYIDHTPPIGHLVHLGQAGAIITDEYNGNHGFCTCTEFHHFNKDVDNGLRKVKAYTITGPAGSETIIEDYFLNSSPSSPSLGMACQTARWGTNIDLAWYNTTHPVESVYVNVLMDWNQDGRWGGSVSCPGSSTPCEEHVLQNLVIDIGGTRESIADFMSSSQREFMIGPNSGYVWARFTITKEPVELPWEGTGNFEDGETEDYLLHIMPYMPPMDYGDAPYPFKTLLQEDGARHIIDPNVYLGSGVSADEDGQPDSLAAMDDDDGVVFQGEWVLGDSITMLITPSIDGFVSIWTAPVDTSGELTVEEDFIYQVSDNVKVTLVKGGKVTAKVEQSKFKEGANCLRVRFSTQPIDSSYGIAPDGEVEDYLIVIEAPNRVTPDPSQMIPKTYSLKQNYPNPFNPETTIEYYLPVTSRIKLSIFDIQGHLIKAWKNTEKSAGCHQVIFNACDENGLHIATGIYIYSMEATPLSTNDKPFRSIQKMILLK